MEIGMFLGTWHGIFVLIKIRLYLDTPSRPGSSIGEGIYETFGVDSKADAPVGVIVRPDGYIGAMIELDEGNTDLRDYFTGILG